MRRTPTCEVWIKLQRMIKRTRRHLFVFMSNRDIPATTNGSERALRPRLRQSCPSQKAEGSRHVRGDSARQQRQTENPIQGRTCLRRTKGPDGLVHSNHRDRESEEEDRTGEPRL